MADFDLLIKNGLVFDGSGAPGAIFDIGVKDGMITAIGADAAGTADEIIDANGMAVSPGFIDEHAHNDGYIFYDHSNIYKLAQGITTEISGNCGEGLAPVRDEFFDEIYEYYRPYYPPENFREFTTEQAFFDAVDALPLGNHQGFLCAHGTLRMAAMGFSEGPADPQQMKTMKAMLREAMEAGALGLSSGLVYSPGCFAPAEELEELCRVVKEYGGIYATHMRSEGWKLTEAVSEAICIARNTGIRVVISHLKCLGRNFWGLSREVTAMIEEARAEGLEIFCDQYPYTQSSAVLHWVIPFEYTAGGFPEMCRRLAIPEERQRIRDMYANAFGPWDNLMENITPAGIHILKADATPKAVGCTLQEYADAEGLDPYDALFDVIIANKADALAAFDCMCENDIEHIMKKDYVSVCTDGIDVFPNEKAHPRLTGSFPKVLGRYVREKKVLPLEQAIWKMTGLPASVMGLKKKGLLREGYDADLCIFDPETVLDTGTFEDFNQRPAGIRRVIVGGRTALVDGVYTGAATGKLIRR